MNEKEIKIVVQGGCVVDVINLPDNFIYEIIDLDNMGVNNEESR